METLQTPPTAVGPVTAPPRHPPLFSLGILLVILGPILYALQIVMKQLMVPWYMPILATLGVLFMARSLGWRRGVWRIGILVLLTAFCGLQWLFLVAGTKVPRYAGPALPGQQVPAFATTLADGRSFADKELKDGTASVLVFFRGRW